MKTIKKSWLEISAYCVSLMMFIVSLVLMFVVTANVTPANVTIYAIVSVLVIWGVIKLHLMQEPKRKMMVALIGAIVMLVISILSILPISEAWETLLCILMALPYAHAVYVCEIELGIIFVMVLVMSGIYSMIL